MSGPGLPRGYVYSLIMTYVCSVAIAIGAVLYANHVDNRSNQQWCELVVPLDDAYSDSAQRPNTEIGRRVARAISHLRDTFEC